MTYLQFLTVGVLPLTVISLLYARKHLNRSAGFTFGILLLIVYAAASPWDNIAVARGLWDFSPTQTLPYRLGYLPLEEYAFFGLQTLLTGAWVWRRLDRHFTSTTTDSKRNWQASHNGAS